MIRLKEIKRKDFGKILRYAAEGMGVKNYTDKPNEIRLYSKYFWYWELSKATQIIGAYDGEEPVGVLLADMQGEKKAFQSLFIRIMLRLSEFLMGILFHGGAESYGNANADMYESFSKRTNPDGEINFLAVEPEQNGKGIGTLLLNELVRREKGKTVYLYTDSNCTYQFYDKRGFIREEVKEITLNLHEKEIPLTCFLYSKKL